MAEEPPESSGTSEPKPTPPQPTLPPRRSLPRAARLSRLQPEGAPADTAVPATAPASPAASPPAAPPAVPPPPVIAPAIPPAAAPPPAPAATGRPRDLSPVEELAAQVARSSRSETVPGVASPSAGSKGGGRGQLTAMDGGLIKDPVVSTDLERGPHMFKALVDKGAQRAAIMSTIGLVLCIAPLLSLIGLVWGIMSLRRIKRSAGSLVGEKTARFAIYLGLVGFIAGVTIDMVFIIRG